MSCYGLLDVNTVLSPSITGQFLEVPYYPGCQYVAYRAVDPMQVSISLMVAYTPREHLHLQLDIILVKEKFT